MKKKTKYIKIEKLKKEMNEKDRKIKEMQREMDEKKRENKKCRSKIEKIQQSVDTDCKHEEKNDTDTTTNKINMKNLINSILKDKSKCILNPFVVLIGIEDYNKDETGLTPLDGVTNDICRMVHLWCDIYKYKNISIVLLPNNNTNNTQ